MTFDRISPDDVTKDDEGDIRVHITTTRNGSLIEMNFFHRDPRLQAVHCRSGHPAGKVPGVDIN